MKASNPVTSGPIGRGSGWATFVTTLAQQVQFSPALTLGTSAQIRGPLATPRTAPVSVGGSSAGLVFLQRF